MEIRAHPDAGLDQSQLEELANRLISERRDLLEMLNTLYPQITLKDDCTVADAAEAASRQESRARASSLADNKRQTITEIDRALERLASGRYGISEESGEPIAFERLLLIPWARVGAHE
jgi:DnaK suppressor protein